mgnify:CR=1 FL=1
MILGAAGCSNKNSNDMTKNTNVENETNMTEVRNTYTQISMEEAVTMMEEETDYIILDVRRPDEFAEKHIPNAINVPNETIGNEPVPELPNEDQRILVYCRSGNRSKQASEKLAAIGYSNVYEFGGIIDWKGETVSE